MKPLHLLRTAPVVAGVLALMTSACTSHVTQTPVRSTQSSTPEVAAAVALRQASLSAASSAAHELLQDVDAARIALWQGDKATAKQRIDDADDLVAAMRIEMASAAGRSRFWVGDPAPEPPIGVHPDLVPLDDGATESADVSYSSTTYTEPQARPVAHSASEVREVISVRDALPVRETAEHIHAASEALQAGDIPGSDTALAQVRKGITQVMDRRIEPLPDNRPQAHAAVSESGRSYHLGPIHLTWKVDRTG